ncbi:MAG: RidA family protein [Candidatus Thorarchaeota archaeon]|nr:MAG: RidA family protein [Candidatus Thorarchaeota archaeon]
MRKIEVRSALGAKSKAHYSAAVVHENLVYVSGQLPVDMDTGSLPEGKIDEQTRQALSNLSRILEASGSSLDKVLRTTAYISDVSHWGDVDKVYAEVFNQHKPARTVVPVSNLHYGALIEIDAVAYI